MYSWKNRRHEGDRIGELALYWEAHGDPVSDDYDSDDVSASELWRIWRKRYPVDEHAEAQCGRGAVHITWFVSSEVFEGAPHAINVIGYEPQTCLDFFTTPIDVAPANRFSGRACPSKTSCGATVATTRAASSKTRPDGSRRHCNLKRPRFSAAPMRVAALG